jgi:hypothetical protein
MRGKPFRWPRVVLKSASWLNMVEIEIGVLRSQCLDRRIATRKQLASEIAAWECQRNASAARIKWMFTTDRARTKMGRAYPNPTSKEPLCTNHPAGPMRSANYITRGLTQI